MIDPNELSSKRQGEGAAGGRVLARVLTVFPMLAVPVLLYMLTAMFAGARVEPDLPAITGSLRGMAVSLPMISNVKWQLSWGDMLLLVSLVCLAVEIVKSTSSRSGAIYNHATSMALLIICLILFLIVGSFATSVFFLITMMALIDVLVGFMVTVVAARRDVGVGDGFAR